MEGKHSCSPARDKRKKKSSKATRLNLAMFKPMPCDMKGVQLPEFL
jgi:hypothetical protein